MASKHIIPTFEVTGQIRATVGVTVSAATMEEALEKARKLNIHDFISFGGNNHMDSETPIIEGIYKNS